jgi:hypothetical protein
MAMELYGKGAVAGIDPGNGPNYEHPMHINYYAVWAAHNTVVAAGASSSVPRVMSGGGTKHIGKIELSAMEPAPKTEALSSNFSFTDTKYFEPSTRTNQQRTMAIIRTSETSGYYLDIYRSDNNISNDYLYHNIGDYVELFNEKGDSVKISSAVYPTVDDDVPGLRFLTDAHATGLYKESIKAHFCSSGAHGIKQSMDVWIPASDNKYFYTASAPVSKTAAPPYNRLPTPVLTIRTEGAENAWKDPFVAIFEPYLGEKGGTVKGVSRKIYDGGNRIIVDVNRIDGNDIIFHATDNKGDFCYNNTDFTGKFGIVSLSGGKLYSMYIGKGQMIKYENIKIEAIDGQNISAFLTLNQDKLNVNSSSAAQLTFKNNTYNISKGFNEIILKQ